MTKKGGSQHLQVPIAGSFYITYSWLKLLVMENFKKNILSLLLFGVFYVFFMTMLLLQADNEEDNSKSKVSQDNTSTSNDDWTAKMHSGGSSLVILRLVLKL